MSKQGDSEDIPTRFIKFCGSLLSNSFCVHFNLCRDTWKQLRWFKFIKKNNVRKILRNSRPISILCNLNKIFESLITSRVKTFFDHYLIIILFIIIDHYFWSFDHYWCNLIICMNSHLSQKKFVSFRFVCHTGAVAARVTRICFAYANPFTQHNTGSLCPHHRNLTRQNTQKHARCHIICRDMNHTA